MRINLLKIQLLNGNSQLGSSQTKDTVDYKTWFPSQCNDIWKESYKCLLFFFMVLAIESQVVCTLGTLVTPHTTLPPVFAFMSFWNKASLVVLVACALVDSSNPPCLSPHHCSNYGLARPHPHRVHFKVKL